MVDLSLVPTIQHPDFKCSEFVSQLYLDAYSKNPSIDDIDPRTHLKAPLFLKLPHSLKKGDSKSKTKKMGLHLSMIITQPLI
jgi:hypothetical protein